MKPARPSYQRRCRSLKVNTVMISFLHPSCDFLLRHKLTPNKDTIFDQADSYHRAIGSIFFSYVCCELLHEEPHSPSPRCYISILLRLHGRQYTGPIYYCRPNVLGLPALPSTFQGSVLLLHLAKGIDRWGVADRRTPSEGRG